MINPVILLATVVISTAISYQPASITYVAPLSPVRVEIVEAKEEICNGDNDPIGCSCVQTARHFGVPIPQGTNARDIESNSYIFEGALALFSYEADDHVGVVKELREDGFVICEGNFDEGEVSCSRLVYYDDPFLRGFHDGKF